VSSVTDQKPERARALPSGWPVRRTPRSVLLAMVAILAVTVALSLVHKPSQAQRATDLRGFLQEVNTDIESCAGGVGESLAALRQVQSGANTATDVSEAISIAQQGSANCSPANNEELDNLESYQVPQSLYSFGLIGAVTASVTWAAPDAQRVQDDVAALLGATSSQAKSQAQATLSRDVAALDAQRAKVDGPISKAIKALAVKAAVPHLPG
jgi:type II secretory pathway pseudopilin PulG